MKLYWKKTDGMYISGISGYVGKWLFFNTFYDGCTSRNQEEKYKLKCFLPGIKNDIGHFKTIEDAKEKANSVLKYWIENLT